uniref:(northern house mosquito) hypothetical protein n=1 Tax=Culex pipiens TaxID=7175 RepID=A0A8D8I782_CULPI
MSAHDHPDGGADRDAGRAGRGGPVEQLQHLQHPGPRGGRHRQGRRAGVRLEGRNRRGVPVVHPPNVGLRRRAAAEHDPGRRRRSDEPGPHRVPAVFGRHQGNQRGDHHGSAQSVQDDEGGQAGRSGDQRERLGYQEQV